MVLQEVSNRHSALVMEDKMEHALCTLQYIRDRQDM